MELSIQFFWLFAVLVCLFFLTKKSRYNFKREYRKCESPIEEILTKALHHKGFRPYTQVACGKYRIDIAVYHKRRKVAIECDGHEFHSTPAQKEHDRKKNKYLEQNGWLVLRFTGKEIVNNVQACVKTIEKRKK